MSAFRAFLGGFARLVDLGGVYQSPSISDPVAAMRADWQRVGDDFRTAMGASSHLIEVNSSATDRVCEECSSYDRSK